jgi:hypothetical protein
VILRFGYADETIIPVPEHFHMEMFDDGGVGYGSAWPFSRYNGRCRRPSVGEVN